MALIKCRECKMRISDQAAACPYCGCPVGDSGADAAAIDAQTAAEMRSSDKKKRAVIPIVIAVLLALALCFVFVLRHRGAEASAAATLTEGASDLSEPSSSEASTDAETEAPSADIAEAQPVDRPPEITMIYRSEIEEVGDGTYRIAVSFVGDEYGIRPKGGYLDIGIVNDKHETVFQKQVTFTESNFSEPAYGGYACYGYQYTIEREAITPGLTDGGEITVTACADGIEFEPFKKTVVTLPLREVTIVLPSLPCSFSDYDLDDQIRATARVHTVQIEQTRNGNGNRADVDLNVLSSMTYLRNPGTSATVTIGYQLKNEAGIIVDSGKIRLESAYAGDQTSAQISFYNLELTETYTLRFRSATTE